MRIRVTRFLLAFLSAGCLCALGVRADDLSSRGGTTRDFSLSNETCTVGADWAPEHRIDQSFAFRARYGSNDVERAFTLSVTNRTGVLSWKDDSGKSLSLVLPSTFNAHGYKGLSLGDGRLLLVYRSACLNPTNCSFYNATTCIPSNKCWLVGWVGPVESLIEKEKRDVGAFSFLLQPPVNPKASPRKTGKNDAIDLHLEDNDIVKITFLDEDAPKGANALVWRLTPENLGCEISWWTRWRPGVVWFGGLLRALLDGLIVSCEIFFLTLLCALPLGLLVAFGRMSKIRLISSAARIYISVMRGTPLMLQIIFVYYGPNYLFGWSLAGYPMLLATVLAFSFNYAAYFAEIYRSGIQSIEMGQWEASKALGLPRGSTFFHIIFPQVVKRVLPAVTNEVITLVKDTSLAFTIAFMEMFTVAKQIAAEKTTIVPLVVAGVFYYIFNYIVAWTMEHVEKHFSYYR